MNHLEVVQKRLESAVSALAGERIEDAQEDVARALKIIKDMQLKNADGKTAIFDESLVPANIRRGIASRAARGKTFYAVNVSDEVTRRVSYTVLADDADAAAATVEEGDFHEAVYEAWQQINNTKAFDIADTVVAIDSDAVAKMDVMEMRHWLKYLYKLGRGISVDLVESNRKYFNAKIAEALVDSASSTKGARRQKVCRFAQVTAVLAGTSLLWRYVFTDDKELLMMTYDKPVERTLDNRKLRALTRSSLNIQDDDPVKIKIERS